MAISLCDTKLLLIEDVPVMQQALLFVLQSLGCRVDCFASGADALEHFRAYDFIFLDIGLPDISGVEVCRRIRAQEIDAHIPIVALTAHHDNKEIIAQCKDVGFDGFVGKPLDEAKAISVLKKYLVGFPCYVDGVSAGEVQ